MKKQLIKGIISASVSLLASNAMASNISDQFDLVPYVGVDAQWRHMEFKKGFGDNITKRNYPQGNVYVGVKLNQYVGLEAGYERTTTVKKSATVLGGDTVLGISPLQPAALTVPYQFATKTNFRAFYGNVVGFYPICEEYRLSLIGSIGIARSKVKIVSDTPTIAGAANPNPANWHREFTKSKWIPKLGLGLQHMVTCQFGVRAMLGWEGTARGADEVKDIKPTNTTTSSAIARLKNSTTVGLGLFYNFN